MAVINKRSRAVTSRFTMIWIIIILTVAAVWTLLLAVATVALREYESVQPRHAAQAVFDEYFAPKDYSSLIAYSASSVTEFESEADMKKYTESLFGSASWTYAVTTSDDPAEKKYNVRSGDKRVGSFTLVPDTVETEMLGLKGYRLGRIEFCAEPLCGVNIYAPLESTVFVNGVVLGQEYVSGDPVVLATAVYFPEDDDDSRVMLNYYVEGLYYPPTVKVTTSADYGCEYKLEYDEKNVLYSAEYNYLLVLADKYNKSVEEASEYRERAVLRRQAAEAERKRLEEERLKREAEERQRISDEIEAKYGSFVVEANQSYCCYIHRTQGMTKAKALSYFKKGTEIYSYITSHPNFELEHDSYRFDNADVYNFEWVDEKHTAFRCHMKMQMILSGRIVVDGRYKQSTWTEDFDEIVYVDISGTKPLIYELSLPTDGE